MRKEKAEAKGLAELQAEQQKREAETILDKFAVPEDVKQNLISSAVPQAA